MDGYCQWTSFTVADRSRTATLLNLESHSTLHVAVDYRTGSSLCSPVFDQQFLCNLPLLCPHPRPVLSLFLSLHDIFSIYTIESCSQPVHVIPSRLSPYWQPVCLPLGSLPSLSCSLATHQLFPNLTVLMATIETPISQFSNPLLLYSFSYTPQSLLPRVLTSHSTFSQKLLTSQSQSTCFPYSQSDPLSPCLRITQLLVPAYSFVCLVFCLHSNLRLLSSLCCQNK